MFRHQGAALPHDRQVSPLIEKSIDSKNKTNVPSTDKYNIISFDSTRLLRNQGTTGMPKQQAWKHRKAADEL
jgi:hypothetical protein